MNYIAHSAIIISSITEYVSISAFAFLIGTPIGIEKSAIGLKICVITAAIKKYKSINKKKKKKHDKIMLWEKSKLNRIEVSVSKALTDSVINYDEFVLIDRVLKKILWYERRN